jgi:IPT/TIG domain
LETANVTKGRISTIRSSAIAVAAAAVACGQAPSLPSVMDLEALVPSSGPVGTSVQVHGSGFATTKNVVKFGSGYLGNIPSADGRTLRFTVPEHLDLCPPADLQSNAPCGESMPRVHAGMYPVAVVTRTSGSRELTFRVTD